MKQGRDRERFVGVLELFVLLMKSHQTIINIQRMLAEATFIVAVESGRRRSSKEIIILQIVDQILYTIAVNLISQDLQQLFQILSELLRA